MNKNSIKQKLKRINFMNRIIESDCLDVLNSLDISPFKNSSILLTGSNGLLGQYLVHLIFLANKNNKLNCKIYCASLHEPNRSIKRLLADKKIIPIKLDLSKPFTIPFKIDYIFHAACYAQPSKFINDPLSTVRLNVNATAILLELAKKNKARLIFFSSAEIYGEIPRELIPVPESYNGNCSTTSVRGIYGESKRLGETLCAAYRRNYDVQTYIARISHVYGPGISVKDERVLGDFIRKALIEKKIRLLDEGGAIKTFGYIADVIGMIMCVMLKGKDMIYNIGGVDSISIRELAEEVGRYCHVPVIVPKKKSNLKHIGNDPTFVKLDLSKFKKEFHSFSFTPFSVGIARNIEWNREEFKI